MITYILSSALCLWLTEATLMQSSAMSPNGARPGFMYPMMPLPWDPYLIQMTPNFWNMFNSRPVNSLEGPLPMHPPGAFERPMINSPPPYYAMGYPGFMHYVILGPAPQRPDFLPENPEYPKPTEEPPLGIILGQSTTTPTTTTTTTSTTMKPQTAPWKPPRRNGMTSV